MSRIEPLPAPEGTNPLQYSALAGIMAHRPEILEAFGRLNRSIRFEGLLPIELKESVRRATAPRVGCNYCVALGELDENFSSERERPAVRFAEKIADDHKSVTDEDFELLRTELTAWICLVTVAGQMFGSVMDVRPATPAEAEAYQDAIHARVVAASAAS